MLSPDFTVDEVPTTHAFVKIAAFSIAAACLLLGTGCGSRIPSPGDGRHALEQLITSQAKGLIRLASFEKTDGQRFEAMGVKGYRMQYKARIEFLGDCTWGGISPMGWSGDLTGERGVPRTDMAKIAAFGKRSGLLGSHAVISGTLIFEKSERGWHSDGSTHNGEAKQESPSQSQPTAVLSDSLASASLSMDAQWTQVYEQYRTRAQIVPQLVNAVVAAGDFDKALLIELTVARASLGQVEGSVDSSKAPDTAELDKYEQAQATLSAALSRVLDAGDKIPALRGDGAFRSLKSQVQEKNQKIAALVLGFNGTIEAYNQELKRRPASTLKAKPVFNLSRP